MAIARIGRCPVDPDCCQKVLDERDSGRVVTTVEGISTGFGGSSPPIFVQTNFDVQHAIANLALEYGELDASAIYSFGTDLNALEIKISYPPTGTGFYIEYFQKDPNATSKLIANYYAVGGV